MRYIQCEDLDAKAFDCFGQVIDASAAAPEPINDGTTQRFADLATFDAGDGRVRPVIGIYLANARRFPLRIAALERHRQAGQAFIPLGLHCFVMVVAPGGENPEWERVRAFVTRTGQGVSLHPGAWHHGLVALGDGHRFAVIEGGNYRDDTQLSSAPQELWLDGPVSVS
ncbi:MAG TPA: ureidoglycolate lyase [Ramlibacter sp.]|nr:ureidoglycolate lyase [Ramlibacter sp.]